MIFTIILVTTSLFASEFEVQKIKILKSSNSNQELNSRLLLLKEVSILKSLCERELNLKLIPENCYRYIDKKALESGNSKEVIEKQRKRLETRCLQTVEDQNIELFIPPKNVVGERCQEAIIKKLEKKRYFLDESNPGENILEIEN